MKVSSHLALPLVCLYAVAAFAGCDRNVEPFVEGEVRTPDLSRIFPAAADEPAPGDGPTAAMPGAGTRGNLPPSRVASGAASSEAEDGEPILGTVELAAGVTAPSSATLFVIARGEAGGGPPLAVRRFAAPELPLDFELGPQHVMIQGMSFAGNIRISARLDMDGNAMTREPGDLAGEALGLVRPGSRGVRIVLDRPN